MRIITVAAAIFSLSVSQPKPPATFASDLAFLNQHTKVIVLTGQGGGQVVVAPEYQGRVMTSTADGSTSFGWIGRDAIASGKRQPHMNVFGGEDRFWLGPEGGQYALYFKPGDPFDVDHWQTPEPFDWGAWPVIDQPPAGGAPRTSVTFTKSMTLTNHAGTQFGLDVQRTVRLLGPNDVGTRLHATVPAGVKMVAFESRNVVRNAGAPWTEKAGLISIWILGQFTPTRSTTIAIPFAQGAESSLGPIVNDAYFGKVPAERLQIKDGVIRFRGDGQYRSKIGLSPQRATGVAGSYDAASHVLTIVQFTQPEGVRDYVNSMWEIQTSPYRGDALNSYNDGPLGPGKPG
ncbi:MAG TPA: DUF6786 family protein, partial [Vicinamibacterales bacterium]|nr:DUF6786 family protein [Vicinamibacterales bacterium]